MYVCTYTYTCVYVCVCVCVNSGFPSGMCNIMFAVASFEVNMEANTCHFQEKKHHDGDNHTWQR